LNCDDACIAASRLHDPNLVRVHMCLAARDAKKHERMLTH
jgi:hypothetical protein